MEDLKILLCDEIEGKVCEELKLEEVSNYTEIINNMKEYCVKNNGGGLSAPQVGIFKNFFIFMKREGVYEVAINPVFYKNSRKQIKIVETCFSCPDRHFLMERNREIQAVYFIVDNGKFLRKGIPLKGIPAISFQHEIDHLKSKTIMFHGVEMKKSE